VGPRAGLYTLKKRNLVKFEVSTAVTMMIIISQKMIIIKRNLATPGK
jgi:hypothetical protein